MRTKSWRQRRLLSQSAAQGFEEARNPVNLVKDDQLVGVVCEVELGRGEPGPVALGLEVEVEVDRGSPLGNGKRKRRLACAG